jgi:tungstate transport system ATP-binding protein
LFSIYSRRKRGIDPVLYELKHLQKKHGGRTVLDLSLGLKKGSVVGLLGPNGAGKTTLLQVLAFLSPPSSGEVWYRQRRVDFTGSNLVELRRTAVLVQQSPVLFTASVFRNVAFPLKIRGIDRKKRKRRIHALLRLVGMETFAHVRADRLSGGETQRVAIAQALACNPEVILLDEPTASVDTENRIIIERIVRDLNREKGISIIFTSHDAIQASRLSDDILFLRDGRLTEYAHENIFSGDIKKNTMGETVCLIGNSVAIPIKTENTGRVQIAIDPRTASVIPEDSEKAAGAPIRGRLVQLTADKDSLRALVNIGVPLNIFVPRDQAALLRVGENVGIDVAPERVVII